MDECHRSSAAKARAAIEQGLHDRASFRAALLAVPASERDAWCDRVLGIEALPDDGPELPAGCVPYLPCAIDSILRMIDEAEVRAADVFVDLGAGLGRAAVLVHLLTGADAVGVEIQAALVDAARVLTARLRLSRVSWVQGDAAQLAGAWAIGSVFFLYCPFGGARLAKVLDDLEPIARTRAVRVCCVDLPLPSRPWLASESSDAGDLGVYRSTLHR